MKKLFLAIALLMVAGSVQAITIDTTVNQSIGRVSFSYSELGAETPSYVGLNSISLSATEIAGLGGTGITSIRYLDRALDGLLDVFFDEALSNWMFYFDYDKDLIRWSGSFSQFSTLAVFNNFDDFVEITYNVPLLENIEAGNVPTPVPLTLIGIGLLGFSLIRRKKI